MDVETHAVSFAPGGQVVSVSGKPPALFARELFTYRDLPGPLAVAVGKALANRCFITMGYRHGPGAPLFAVMIDPGSEADSQHICLYLSERQSGTISTDLAAHLFQQLRNGAIKISVVEGLQDDKSMLNKPGFPDFQKQAVHAAVEAMGSTMELLTAFLRQRVGPRTISIGELLSRSAGASCRADKWTCSGDESLTFCGNIDRLHCLFRYLLKGSLGQAEASIHWTGDALGLGASAAKLEITTVPSAYNSYFRHAGYPFVYADVDGGWKCALRETIIDAQGCVEFAPNETPACLRIWLPLKLPDSF